MAAWRGVGLAIVLLGCGDSGVGTGGAADGPRGDGVSLGADGSGVDGAGADAAAAGPDAAPGAADAAPDAVVADARPSCGCEVGYPPGGALVDREVVFDMDGDGILERADIGPRAGFPGLESVLVHRAGVAEPIVLEDYCGVGGGCSGPLAIYRGRDIDGDGTEELLVHKPDDYYGGQLMVHFGSATGIGVLPGRQLGTGDGEWTGRSQAGADFNGDGRADIAMVDIGARYTRSGAVKVFYGAPAPTLLTTSVRIANAHQIERLVGDDDCNDDGYPDLVLRNTIPSPDTDEVYWGGPGGLGAAVACTFDPPPRPAFSCGCELTPVVAGGDTEVELDVDGDAVMDRAVVATNPIVGAAGRQRVEVYLGGSAVPAVLEQGCGEPAGYCPGSLSIHQGHDVNGDGADDLLVHGTRAGAAGTLAVYLGSATGLVAPATVRIVGPDLREAWGATAPGADLNADGYADVVYAQPSSDGTTTGSVAVRYGGPAPGTLTTEATWSYVFPFDPLAMTHPATQDCDDDGVPDLVIQRPASRKLTVHAGGPGGPSVDPTCTVIVE